MTESGSPRLFFYSSAGKRHGPVTAEQLKSLAASGVLTPSDTVWESGDENGVSAGRIEGLFQVPQPGRPSGLAADIHQGQLKQDQLRERDAFISYSSQDKLTADAICATLERDKVRCWIAPRDVLPGINYAEAIIDGLNSSHLMVVVLSSASNASPQVLREVERAVSKAIPIIPFRIENVVPSKSMEFYLSAPHWLDALTKPVEAHIERLSSVVRAVVAQNRRPPMPPQTARESNVETEQSRGEHLGGSHIEPRGNPGTGVGMNNAYKEHLIQTLERGAASLRETGLPAEDAAALERLAMQVDSPCVLAVVGRLKAGKSTFVNALLGEDVAKVGVTETTATFNRFRYGNPADPERPLRCRWRSGRDEHVSRAFLNSLQGNDVEALRRADGIEYLEFLLPNPCLREVTLVDTPGTLAVVQEHQNRTAEFRNLQNQLRDRHNQETQRIATEADAVIYLVGPVSRSSDQAFLEEFTQTTGGRSRALNGIGVMAKIDLQPEILTRRMELAAKMAEQLKDSLSTVVPVSAGIYRALQHLRANHNAELIRLMTTLRRIPAKRLPKLLDDDQLYLGEYLDCPVTVAERERVLGTMDWSVFTTVARLAADPALSEQAILERLEELAGFGPLQKVLERHFFWRARFLRCYRINNDARKIVNDIRYGKLPEFRKRDQADIARRERFLGFLRSTEGNHAPAKELEDFISLQCGTAAPADRLEATVKEVDRQLATLFHEMEECNADFEALEEIDKRRQLFSPAELEELRCLLGLYGVDLEKRLPAGRATVAHACERQQAWSEACRCATDPVRSQVAERAQARYGLILYDLTKNGN